VAISWIALFPGEFGRVVTIGLSAAITVGTLAGWAMTKRNLLTKAWPLLLSYPVMGVVLNGNLMSAIGLAALSLAIWAQRRDYWLLVGVAMAIASERLTNAIPIGIFLLVSGWGQPRKLLTAGAGGLAVLLPLAIPATIWDKNWITDYIGVLGRFPFTGPLAPISDNFGLAGDVGILLTSCLIAGWLGRASRGRGVDLDSAALAIAVTVLFTTVHGLYCAVFVVPGLIRLTARPKLANSAWLTAMLPWLLISWACWSVAGPHPLIGSWIVFVQVPLLVIFVWPLARPIPAESRASTTPRLASA
jgi:hypothetical protein